MARGWESKSVESQMESAADKPTGTRPMTSEEAQRRRERESLQLARSRVLQQLEVVQEPRYIKQLHDALEDLNARIARLE